MRDSQQTRATTRQPQVQCTSCYSAYHPLCGRLAGLHMELHEGPADAGGDGGEASVRLVSYCARHCTPHPELSGVDPTERAASSKTHNVWQLLPMSALTCQGEASAVSCRGALLWSPSFCACRQLRALITSALRAEHLWWQARTEGVFVLSVLSHMRGVCYEVDCRWRLNGHHADVTLIQIKQRGLPTMQSLPHIPGVRYEVDAVAEEEAEEDERQAANGLWNAQPFRPPPAAPLPTCPAGCARAQPVEVPSQTKPNPFSRMYLSRHAAPFAPLALHLYGNCHRCSAHRFSCTCSIRHDSARAAVHGPLQAPTMALRSRPLTQASALLSGVAARVTWHGHGLRQHCGLLDARHAAGAAHAAGLAAAFLSATLRCNKSIHHAGSREAGSLQLVLLAAFR